MKRNIIVIKTSDTKKEYSFEENVENKNPQIWRVTVHVDCADSYTKLNHYPKRETVDSEIYVERKSLIEAGMLCMSHDEIVHDTVTAIEKPEDLIIRLLESVGVYPES